MSVTREEIVAVEGSEYKEASWKLHDIVMRLLSERDEALEEAAMKVANGFFDDCIADAIRSLKEKK